MSRLAPTAILLIVAAGIPFPGSSAQSKDYTISARVNLVLLDASVRDARGGYVTGLPQTAFQVIDDGRPARITTFANADAPVTVGLVVDNSGSMRVKRPEVIFAGLAFAKESNPKDEFFVVNFNDSVVRGPEASPAFTDDLQALRSALYLGEPVGRTALYDAIAYSLKHLEQGHHDKRTLIVVSDGGDNASSVSFRTLVDLIESSRVTIYTVALSNIEDPGLNLGVLRKMASMSGGQFFQPERMEDVSPVFQKISKDIRSRYTLGYVPSESNDTRQARTVKVLARSDGRKLTVKTRSIYKLASPLKPVGTREGP